MGLYTPTTQFVNEHSTIWLNWRLSMVSLAKLTSLRLRTNWLRVRVPLQSLHTQKWEKYEFLNKESKTKMNERVSPTLFLIRGPQNTRVMGFHYTRFEYDAETYRLIPNMILDQKISPIFPLRFCCLLQCKCTSFKKNRKI